MQISQLIKELEGIKAEHGDILVAAQECDCDVPGDWAGINVVIVYEGRCWDYHDPDTCYEVRKHVRLCQ